MAKQLIGKDLTAYLVTPGGIDTAGGVPSAGSAYSYLGKWKSIEFSADIDWFMTTSSDANIKERRAGPLDWKASATGQVRADTGSIAITLALGTNFVYLVFTEVGSGKTLSCMGGIEHGGGTFGEEAWEDKLDIINVGYLPTYQ